jgi:hypothetical protein
MRCVEGPALEFGRVDLTEYPAFRNAVMIILRESLLSMPEASSLGLRGGKSQINWMVSYETSSNAESFAGVLNSL